MQHRAYRINVVAIFFSKILLWMTLCHNTIIIYRVIPICISFFYLLKVLCIVYFFLFLLFMLLLGYCNSALRDNKHLFIHSYQNTFKMQQKRHFSWRNIKKNCWDPF